MRSATFRNIALGILALAVAYHLGARSATAQAPGNPVVALGNGTSGFQITAVTSNGDLYGFNGTTWNPMANVFGSPTPVQHETFGGVKARYR